jgi:hypothetical protein
MNFETTHFGLIGRVFFYRGWILKNTFGYRFRFVLEFSDADRSLYERSFGMQLE